MRYNPKLHIMKKVFLLVAVFLVGITTQAETNTNTENVTINPGNTNRYTNAQEITFVENGVLYAVSTDGSFSFKFLHSSQNGYRRGGQQQVYYNNNRRGSQVVYNQGRRAKIARDRRGTIISIGSSQITYQRNGKVIQIGKVPLRYRKGLMVRAGNMDITYNRRGKIKDTHGFINRENRNQWHDDWYSYNDGRRDKNDNEWNDLERQHDRKRKSK